MKLYVPHRQRVFIKEKGLFNDLGRHKANRLYPERLPDLAGHSVMLFRPMAMSDDGIEAALDGAALTYSMWEGYLTQDRSRKVLKWLDDQGIPWQVIHTSGHASVADLKRFAGALARVPSSPSVPSRRAGSGTFSTATAGFAVTFWPCAAWRGVTRRLRRSPNGSRMTVWMNTLC